MRYTITINQLAIVTNNLDIDLKDTILLDYIYWLCNTLNEKLNRAIIDGETYTWFDYEYFLNQNPLLNWKSKSSLSLRLEELEKKGFIKTYLTTEYIKKKYVKILEKTELLYSGEFNSKNTKKIKNNNQKNKSPLFKKMNRTPVQKNEQESIYIDNNINNIEEINKKNNNNKIPESQKNEEIFVWKDYLNEMLNDKKEHIKLIARFFKYRDLEYSSKKATNEAIIRFSRIASKLVKTYTDEELQWAAKYCRNAYPDIQWTLDTMLKALTSGRRNSNGFTEANKFNKYDKKIEKTNKYDKLTNNIE